MHHACAGQSHRPRCADFRETVVYSWAITCIMWWVEEQRVLFWPPWSRALRWWTIYPCLTWRAGFAPIDRCNPKLPVDDTKYGTVANIVGLEREEIRAYLPMTDFSEKPGLYPAEQFQYDAARDLYVCPQGQELKRYSRRQREEVTLYRAKLKLCNGCPAKA